MSALAAPAHLTVDAYEDLRARLAEAGYDDEYRWAQSVGEPSDAGVFFAEYGWVVVNSGMKAQVAQVIWGRITDALEAGLPVSSAYGHPGKAAAIQAVWDDRERYYAEYLTAPDKVEHLASLPWIGQITKWHLAKNFGVDCAKPDRHLVRIAGDEGAPGLCERLAAATGDRIGTVDVVIWRAANLGWI